MQISSTRTVLIILAVLTLALGATFLISSQRSSTPQSSQEFIPEQPQTGEPKKTSSLTLSTSDDIDLLEKEILETDIESVDQELELILQDLQQL